MARSPVASDCPSDPVVVLVLASPRSGTTMLGALLDLHPDVRFVGELNKRRSWLERGGFCGCGRSYADCPFWSKIAARPAFSETTASRIDFGADSRLLQARCRGMWPTLRALTVGPSTDQVRYVQFLEQLYRDIALEAGARVIVETSKRNLNEVVLLKLRSALTIEIVHLHRDPRGVVASRLRDARRKAANGASRHPRAVASGWPIVVKDALAWTRFNATTWFVGEVNRRRAPVLAYEQLSRDPRRTVSDLLDHVGLEPGEIDQSWRSDTEVELPENHSMAGNRVRRARGSTRIETDNRWREDLPPVLATSTRLLTAPVRALLVRSRRRLARSGPVAVSDERSNDRLPRG